MAADKWSVNAKTWLAGLETSFVNPKTWSFAPQFSSISPKTWLFGSRQNISPAAHKETTTEHPATHPDVASPTASTTRKHLVVGAVTAGAALVAVPLALNAVGFGVGGIVAGSIASSTMSFAATKGIGMFAVGACQSAGAVGTALSTKILVATAAGTAGNKISNYVSQKTGNSSSLGGSSGEGTSGEKIAADNNKCKL